jgi:hypothetical protein
MALLHQASLKRKASFKLIESLSIIPTLYPNTPKSPVHDAAGEILLNILEGVNERHGGVGRSLAKGEMRVLAKGTSLSQRSKRQTFISLLFQR